MPDDVSAVEESHREWLGGFGCGLMVGIALTGLITLLMMGLF